MPTHLMDGIFKKKAAEQPANVVTEPVSTKQPYAGGHGCTQVDAGTLIWHSTDAKRLTDFVAWEAFEAHSKNPPY